MNIDAFFKRIKFSITPVIITMLVLPGCGKDNMVEYVNSEKGFSISFPKNWEKKEGFLGSTVIALEPIDDSDGTFRSNVAVVAEPITPGMSDGDYYKLQFKSLSQLTGHIKNFKLHSNRYANVGSEKAKQLVYSYNIGQLRVTVISRAVIREKTGYIITGTSNNIVEFSNKYRKIAESFKFL